MSSSYTLLCFLKLQSSFLFVLIACVYKWESVWETVYPWHFALLVDHQVFE